MEESSFGSPAPGRPFPKALGYASVSAHANGSAQDELVGQAEAIQRACERRGLDLVWIVREVEATAGASVKRPALRHVLERIAAGEAGCLVVRGLDRLGGSAAAIGKLVSWFEADGRRLVAADLGLDTDSETGKVASRALAAAGQLESRKLAERTRRGLAAARAKGPLGGRPSVSDRRELCERIALMRAEGMTLQAIADELNAEAVPTLRGVRSGVRRACRPPPATSARGAYAASRTSRTRAAVPKPNTQPIGCVKGRKMAPRGFSGANWGIGGAFTERVRAN
ncbi:MAG TPA: recombinase family protein [Beijerinckiaceae bacterium]|nr:recombinase family protein [Beijerinckiaceae bacterium]